MNLRALTLAVVVAVSAGCAGGSGPDAGAGGGSGGGGGGSGGGVGGGSADAGTTCQELSNSYGQAVPKARECNPASLVNECTARRESILGCGCFTYLAANGVSSPDSIAAQFTGRSCLPPACPAVVRPAATGGSCTPNKDGGFDGTCTDTL